MIVDLSQIPHEVRVKMHEIFTRDFDLKAARAIEEQKEIARHFHNNRPRSVDGIGEQRMALHPFLDMAHRLERGPNCWADRDFRSWFIKKNPEVQVRSGGTKLMVGWNAPSKRYTKSYSDTLSA